MANERNMWVDGLVGYIHGLENRENKSTFYQLRSDIRSVARKGPCIERLLAKFNIYPADKAKVSIITEIVTAHGRHAQNTTFGHALWDLLKSGSKDRGAARFCMLTSARLDGAGRQMLRMAYRIKRGFNHYDLAHIIADWDRQDLRTRECPARNKLCSQFFSAKNRVAAQ